MTATSSTGVVSSRPVTPGAVDTESPNVGRTTGEFKSEEAGSPAVIEDPAPHPDDINGMHEVTEKGVVIAQA